MKEYVGEQVVAGMPPLFEIPLVEMQEAQAAQVMRRPELAAKLARHADTGIPDQTTAMERLVAGYMRSPLAAFHKWFYSQEPHGPMPGPHPTTGRRYLAPGDGHINWEEFLYHLAEIQFGGTIILEIAGTGTSASILQAAQRGRKHLSGIARHLTES